MVVRSELLKVVFRKNRIRSSQEGDGPKIHSQRPCKEHERAVIQVTMAPGARKQKPVDQGGREAPARRHVSEWSFRGLG